MIAEDRGAVANAGNSNSRLWGRKIEATNNIIHHPDLSYPHHAFQRLPADEQKKILDRMAADERKEYPKSANKKLRETYHP